MSSTDLHQLLKRYWGYSEFRARQQSIIESIIAGRDAAVIMPTGGGKSLCYQLPAVAMGGTCVVVSPLIALMQDQARQLQENGIPAAFLNSTLDGREQSAVRRDAESGKLRLLYLSPERLVREDMAAWLRRVPISFFAIDEAHCISEWGHEFRPEYRQLKMLRDVFPDQPIAAFTASATSTVRHDIVRQLGLRDPAKFVASFHRPNLRYVVRQCKGDQQAAMLRSAIEWYDEGSVIVYAPTIKSVEATTAILQKRGVGVVAYHGQMKSDDRRRNQEIWMTGEKRVLVGTLAFGLGINKPDVRAVIHLSLPKSLEQYYQEAGRAGRDGDPADCVLLWQSQDVGLLTYFVDQIEDAAEKQRAWQRYHVMRRFVESDTCRHRQICAHFGEQAKWETCAACDACGYALEWVTEAHSAPVAKPRRKVRDTTPVDSAVRTRLREWRSTLAKSMKVPAFIILPDTTLDAIARDLPRNLEELLEVPGIGERKAQRFGAAILEQVGRR
ncbi:MAG: ATP-dependent DNA helicase RecQ [Bryobacteraceae bacterium]